MLRAVFAFFSMAVPEVAYFELTVSKSDVLPAQLAHKQTAVRRYSSTRMQFDSIFCSNPPPAVVCPHANVCQRRHLQALVPILISADLIPSLLVTIIKDRRCLAYRPLLPNFFSQVDFRNATQPFSKTIFT